MATARHAALAIGVVLSLGLTFATIAYSSDHDDGKKTGARPEADIADVFSWMSADTGRANLVMTVFPSAPASARFATDVQYVFQTARHEQYGVPPFARDNVLCTFDKAAKQNISCWVGNEYVGGDASSTTGITNASGKLRVFAGLRDDPAFFNRSGFLVFRAPEATAPVNTQPSDPAGCQASSGSPFPGGGDSFNGKNVLAIVLSVDKALLVDTAHPVLSVSASTRKSP